MLWSCRFVCCCPQGVDLKVLDNSTYILEAVMNAVNVQLSVQMPDELAASTTADALATIRTKLFPGIESARVIAFHRLDFLTSASQQSTSNSGALSAAAFSFASTSFHWETYTDGSGKTQYKLVAS